MTTLRQRLQRLEARLTDTNGFVPNSEEWYRYWENIVDRFIVGEEPTFRGRIPLAVIDHMIEEADRADGLLQ